MTTDRKGRTGGHPATPITSMDIRHSTALVARIKAAIVTLTLWGLLPVSVADWLIHRGGPGHD